MGTCIVTSYQGQISARDQTCLNETRVCEMLKWRNLNVPALTAQVTATVEVESE